MLFQKRSTCGFSIFALTFSAFLFQLKSLQPIPIRLRTRQGKRHRFGKKKYTSEVISFKIPSLQNEGNIQHEIDNYLMKFALFEAKKASAFGEVPIGALVTEVMKIQYVHDLKSFACVIRILSSGKNEVEERNDASAHAEMLAMRSAGRVSQNWRLLGTTLYSTLEPCPMCLSAAQAFRVSRIVYAAPDLRLGAIETHMRLLDYNHPFHNTIEVVGGIRDEDAKALIQDFFKKRRKSKIRQDSNRQEKQYIGWKALILYLRKKVTIGIERFRN